jgi:hypothetical protein
MPTRTRRTVLAAPPAGGSLSVLAGALAQGTPQDWEGPGVPDWPRVHIAYAKEATGRLHGAMTRGSLPVASPQEGDRVLHYLKSSEWMSNSIW